MSNIKNPNIKALNSAQLPQNYHFKMKMDLKNDKKINIAIQGVFLFLVAVMIGLAVWLNFPTKNNWSTGVTVLVTVAMCAVYMIMHELIHGIFLKFLSGVKPKYFVRFPFLCTGSEAYFNKQSFSIIALAPVIILGILLIAMLTLLPTEYFLSLYIVTGLNFAGAAGDYFQVFAIQKLSPTVLIQDNGKETKVFLPVQ
jgi:hypothetical protein